MIELKTWLFPDPLDSGCMFKLRRDQNPFIGENVPHGYFCIFTGEFMADIELIDMKDIHKAYDRVERGDVCYRFVIDMATLDK